MEKNAYQSYYAKALFQKKTCPTYSSQQRYESDRQNAYCKNQNGIFYSHCLINASNLRRLNFIKVYSLYQPHNIILSNENFKNQSFSELLYMAEL